MRLRLSVILIGLIGALLPTQAIALTQTVNSVPAPFINFYKSPVGAFAQKAGAEPSANLDKQSQININFNTVPQEYRPAIQAAVDVWSQNFKSSIPINVETLYERQANAGVLAAASPGRFFNGFTGEPDPTLWYASAMANAIAGKDLDPNTPEVTIRINSTNGPSLYLGTDGNCPRNQFDLESIVIHELAHGLGFLSNADYDQVFRNGSLQRPTPYDAYAQLPDGRRLMDLPTPSAELGMAMTNSLVWSGANGVKANGGIKPKLYTPAVYELGSSISHLDEATFSGSPTDSVMTPNLANGEVFHSPGPLATAMMQDMLLKPPAGTPFGIPQAPQNVRALVGDKSAVIYFDPPANARTAQVTTYKVHVTPLGIDKEFTESPATISGLKNGTTYIFSVTALNSNGISDAAISNSVVPQANWASSVIDKSADGKYLAQGTYSGNQFVLYSDSKHGQIKMATYLNSKWQIKTIDGDSTISGRTTNDVSGNISFCTGKSGKKNLLDVLYADLTDKDLRLAEFDGIKWSYSIVDGNAAAVQDYKEPDRVRTGSDVSVSSACARTTDGLQVFYRDQSQGIILGATKNGSTWSYEIVDGDKNTMGRSTGDVGFHIKALNIGDKVYLLYDSVNTVNMENKAIRGEVRLATRSTSNTEDWNYETVQSFGGLTAVAGFDVSMLQQGKNIYASWLTASGFSIPNADQISWGLITPISTSVSVSAKNYGVPSAPISIGDKYILFNCASRLCAINRSSQATSLVSTKNFDNSARSEWMTLNKVRYVITSSDGKLSLFKQP
jgi:hypothetical protein